MILFLSMYFIAVVGSVVHIYSLPQNERIQSRVIELLLLYQIVFSLGMTSFLAFIGFTFMPVYIAALTDWTACQFEQQLGNVNLAFAVLGVLCVYYRGYFWAATIIGFSVWILSDGIHHIYKALFENNLSSGNIGVPLWTDILVPTLLLILLYLYMKNINREQEL